MLAFKAHSRHPTWPPTVRLLPDSFLVKESTPPSFFTSSSKHSYTATLAEISEDDDPFSHFLSPVLEEESSGSSFGFEDDETSYSAGIAPYTPSSNSQKDAFFRARLEERWETFVARRLLQPKPSPSSISSSAAAIAGIPRPFLQQSLAPSTPPAEAALPELMDETMENDLPSPCSNEPSSPRAMNWYFPSTIDSLSFDDEDMSDADDVECYDGVNVDGWAADRELLTIHKRAHLSPAMKGRRKFRTTTRNASGMKHAWREPDPDLWTVEEEEAVVAVDDFSEGEERGRTGRARKRVKTVHWNEEVLVLEYDR